MDKLQINKSEYSEILLRAVAQIRVARTQIAKQINNSVNSVYWNLGKLLFEKQLEKIEREINKNTNKHNQFLNELGLNTIY